MRKRAQKSMKAKSLAAMINAASIKKKTSNPTVKSSLKPTNAKVTKSLEKLKKNVTWRTAQMSSYFKCCLGFLSANFENYFTV